MDESTHQYHYITVRNGSNCCPRCESENINGGGWNADDDYTTQECTCGACGLDFDNVYKHAYTEVKVYAPLPLTTLEIQSAFNKLGDSLDERAAFDMLESLEKREK